MQYQGGKHRQARTVAEAVRERMDGRTRYVEPFVGGGSVLAAVAPLFVEAEASDIVPELIELWRAVRDGWQPPERLSREDWWALKGAPPSALKGWAAYGVSYRGSWFHGYAAVDARRDRPAESRRGILRKAASVGHVTFDCHDYAASRVDESSVVYCDPPYAGTSYYRGQETCFDSARLWATLTAWAQAGALVLVHEYAAPDGWVAVSSRRRVETMNYAAPSTGARQETLWTLQPHA